eukprot:1158743-Pelagomonas_calceolata.AAC.2
MLLTAQARIDFFGAASFGFQVTAAALPQHHTPPQAQMRCILQNYVNSALQGSGYSWQQQQQQDVQPLPPTSQPAATSAQPIAAAPQPAATTVQPSATAPQPSNAVSSGQHSPKLSGSGHT